MTLTDVSHLKLYQHDHYCMITSIAILTAVIDFEDEYGHDSDIKI